jgi:hypothetical protein
MVTPEREIEPVKELDQLTDLAEKLYERTAHSVDSPYFLLTASEEAFERLYPKETVFSADFPWTILRQSNLDSRDAEAFQEFGTQKDFNEFVRHFCAEVVCEVLRKDEEYRSRDEERMEDFIKNW